MIQTVGRKLFLIHCSDHHSAFAIKSESSLPLHLFTVTSSDARQWAEWPIWEV